MKSNGSGSAQPGQRFISLSLDTLKSYIGEYPLYDISLTDGVRRLRSPAQTIVTDSDPVGGNINLICKMVDNFSGSVSARSSFINIPYGNLTRFTSLVDSIPSSVDDINEIFKADSDRLDYASSDYMCLSNITGCEYPIFLENETTLDTSTGLILVAFMHDPIWMNAHDLIVAGIKNYEHLF